MLGLSERPKIGEIQPQKRPRKGRYRTCAGRPEVLCGQSRQGSFVQRFLRRVGIIRRTESPASICLVPYCAQNRSYRIYVTVPTAVFASATDPVIKNPIIPMVKTPTNRQSTALSSVRFSVPMSSLLAAFLPRSLTRVNSGLTHTLHPLMALLPLWCLLSPNRPAPRPSATA